MVLEILKLFGITTGPKDVYFEAANFFLRYAPTAPPADVILKGLLMEPLEITSKFIIDFESVAFVCTNNVVLFLLLKTTYLFGC